MFELVPALPTHPRTGLTSIGLRRNGEPIWPVLGGAPDDGDDASGTDDAGDIDSGTDDDAGAGGEPKTSDKVKDWEAEFKAQQRINRDLERRSKQTKLELETKLAEAQKPKPKDGEPVDVDEILKRARDEAKAETLKERVLDKIEARAAKRFNDVEDALLRLGKNIDDFVDDGKVDIDAIDDALADLLAKRPDFGVTQGEQPKPKPRFEGSGDGGPKGSAGKPQLTKADVERLTKERKYQEIEQARKEGRLDRLLGITNQ